MISDRKFASKHPRTENSELVSTKVELDDSDGYARVEIRIIFRSYDWKRFDEYCLNTGNGNGANAIVKKVTQFLLARSADLKLDSNRVKSAYSPHSLGWHLSFAKYLVTAHITVLVVNWLISLIYPGGEFRHQLTVFIYQFSLALSLISLALVLIRKSVLGNQRDFLAESEKNALVRLSDWSEKVFAASLVVFLSAATLNLVLFLLLSAG